MKRPATRRKYVVCIDNDDYPVSLVVRRIYTQLPDAAAAKRGLLRVVDESGEDYLFPKKLFAVVELPTAVQKKLAAT
jgi:hypothetical protein